jgi:hypothetical protein
VPIARRLSVVAASAVVALAVAVTAHAQGHGNGNANGHKSQPPSSSALLSPASTTSASPLSWIDDASLLAPGSMTFTISALRWSGADLSEVDVPIVDAAAGLTKRLQIGASIPHVVGSADGTGPVGGLGTAYITGKVALLTEREVKLAVSPVLEILGAGAAQALPVGDSRYQLGLPVSLEVVQGSVRIFAATGFFTRGAWFAGGGTGFQLTPKTGASATFTRSWAKTDVDGVNRDRREISGGLSHFVRPQIAVYGSLGHTIATADESGAGMTVSGGVTFLLTPNLTK